MAGPTHDKSLGVHRTPEAVAPLLREGFDALHFGFAIFDKDLSLIACNQAFRELRGYPAALCQPGTNIAEFYRFNAERGDYGPGEWEALIVPRMARARSRASHAMVYELPTSRILSVQYTPIRAGGLLIAYMDVTEREHTKQALEQSRERYSLAMAGANEGMWDWLASSDEIVISESYKRLIGIDIPSDRITLAEWVGMIHPEDLIIRERARRAHFEEGAEFYQCEYRVRCGDGNYRWFRDKASSRRNDAGKVVRMSGSLTDVTARRIAERALQDANKQITEQNKILGSLSEQLSKYVSPQIYASIFSGKQSADISSRRKKLTVFFCDIANFTRIAERLEPEELTGLLNRYLTEMSKIAMKYGATVDKFMGDAIMGFFGDPESRGTKKDALACVQMAQKMQERIGELQREWHDEGIEHPVNVRIGISTGYCTVGNFGSEDRMDYTIIGSEVNLASRLESHSVKGGVLISHETFSLIKETIAVEEREPIAVKGFSHPVQCYRVIGALDALQREGRIIRKYDEGVRIFLDLYRGDKSRVIDILEEILGELKPH